MSFLHYNFNKKYLIAVVGLVAVLLTIIFLRNNGNDEGATMKSASIELGSIEEVVTSQGKLEPRDYVDVGAQISGQLKKLRVEIGDVVKAGDLLAEIDPRIYEAKVEADTAKLKNLTAQKREEEASLVLAQQRLQREKTLLKTQATSIQAVEEATAAMSVSAARVEALSAQMEEIESTLEGDRTNLGFTKINAPMDGIVVDMPAREGQTLNANQTAPIILQLANLETMTVRAQVAEADISRLKTDMDVSFSPLGILERRWKGKVRQILPTPEVINDVVLYNVLIDVDNSDQQLMKGMSTQISFILGQASQVPLISIDALGKRVPDKDTQGAKAYEVKVKGSRGYEKKIVQIGLMTRTAAEIKSGLAVGDIVLFQIPARKDAGTRPATGAGGGAFRGGPRL